jgi:hypothetical protein
MSPKEDIMELEIFRELQYNQFLYHKKKRIVGIVSTPPLKYEVDENKVFIELAILGSEDHGTPDKIKIPFAESGDWALLSEAYVDPSVSPALFAVEFIRRLISSKGGQL